MEALKDVSGAVLDDAMGDSRWLLRLYFRVELSRALSDDLDFGCVEASVKNIVLSGSSA